MAKKKPVSPDALLKSSCFVMKGIIGAAAGAHQTDGIYTSDGEEIGGLPLQYLSQRYMYQAATMQLGRLQIFAGKEETCKSAFSIETLRWHALCGGGGFIVGTEGRDIKTLRDSILNYKPDVCEYMRRPTTESYQAAITKMLQQARKEHKEREAGLSVPIQFTVDSLHGCASEVTWKQVEKDGYAKSGFPVEAKIINIWIRTQAPSLEGYPWSLVVTNHLHDAISDNPIPGIVPEKALPGGQKQRASATYLFEFHKSMDLNGRAPTGEQFFGRRINIRARKISMASMARHRLTVDMIWWHEVDPETGELRQRTIWDWPRATIEMLLAKIDTRRNRNTTERNAVREVLDLETVGPEKNYRIYSDALGIAKSDAVSMREASAMLEHRTDLMLAVERALHIEQRPALPVAVAWMEANLAAEARARAAVVATAPERDTEVTAGDEFSDAEGE